MLDGSDAIIGKTSPQPPLPSAGASLSHTIKKYDSWCKRVLCTTFLKNVAVIAVVPEEAIGGPRAIAGLLRSLRQLRHSRPAATVRSSIGAPLVEAVRF